jgi:PmbA protein
MDHEILCKDIRDSLTKREIEQFEIFLMNARSLSIEVKDQEVDSYHHSEENALALRLIKGQRMGFSYATCFGEENIAKVVEDAVNGSSSSAQDEFHGFPGQSENKLPALSIVDTHLSQVPKEEKIEKAMLLERLTLSFDPRIKKVRKCSYGETSFMVTIVNSQGVNRSQEKSLVNVSVMAVAEDGGDSQSGWDFDFSYFFDQLNVEKVGTGAASRALEMLGAQRSKSVKCPVILDNFSASQFLEVLSSSFLAESVQKGKSLLRGKVGEDIFSPVLDILDDGLYPGGMATSCFDGEGVVRQSTPLVRGGVLRGFLYDTYCARKDRVESTGNNYRGSFRVPPSVGVSNLVIRKGDVSLDELLLALDQGVLVTDVMGIHTADPISGDFSVGVAGFWVEGGRKSFPLKGMALSGNLVDLFKNVKLVGSDLRFLGHIGSPSLLLEPMDVSGE